MSFEFWLCCLLAVPTGANAFTILSFDSHHCQSGNSNYNCSFTGLLFRLDEVMALDSIFTVKSTQGNGNRVEIRMQVSNCNLVQLKIK